MKKGFLFLLICTIVGVGMSEALTFPAGTYYFDNSYTQWAQPQLIMGENTIDMTALDEGSDMFQFEIAEEIEEISEYYFVNGLVPDEQEECFEDFQNTDMLTMEPKEGRAFYPTYVVLANTGGRVEKKGYWRTLESYNLSPSGTLPVIYINSEDSKPVITKESYVNATYYLDPMGMEGIEAVGSAEKPLATQIKGRGNYSWNAMIKKPYRLKLDKKAGLLGMNKSKHFALLAHADDWFCSLRDEIGFEVARRMNMPWTSAHQPIEVVLNGDYMGIYWLTEIIRVDKDRVNITEQADGETDPELITGGWLVEIDNYEEEGQVRIEEGDGTKLRFTPKTPEELSAEQRAYLTDLVTAANVAIYNEDKSNTEWENYIDIDALARFYVIQEVVDNVEAFNGSCYWNKEKGEDTKIIFGPVWDFGTTFLYYFEQGCKFIYDYEMPSFAHHWIKEIAKFPRFQKAIIPHWKNYCDNIYPELEDYMTQYCNKISTAIDADGVRWPDGVSRNLLNKSATYNKLLKDKYDFLDAHWGSGSESVISNKITAKIVSIEGGKVTFSNNIATAQIYDIAGRKVKCHVNGNVMNTSASNGIYLVSVIFSDGSSLSSKIEIK